MTYTIYIRIHSKQQHFPQITKVLNKFMPKKLIPTYYALVILKIKQNLNHNGVLSLYHVTVKSCDHFPLIVLNTLCTDYLYTINLKSVELKADTCFVIG